MDNDVHEIDYCISFQTAINLAGEFINRIRSTAGSHSETVLFRLFGCDAGFTALETAIVTWSDRLLIPEVPVDIDILAEQLTQRLPGIRFLPIDLTYFLRRGVPDEYDKHMAIFYANLVMSVLESGTHGVMAAHRNGHLSLAIFLGKTCLRGVWIPLTITLPANVLEASTLQDLMNHSSRSPGTMMLF